MRTTSRRRRAENVNHARRYNGGKGHGTEFNAAPPPEAIPAGSGWCEDCHQIVRLRVSDGLIGAHHSRAGVTCPGGTFNRSIVPALCDHGNAPNERRRMCGCPRSLPVESAAS